MKHFLKNRSQKGFTLIELLVVIAIIGILSSVVLASLNNARVKARDARRVADIKQIQVALELYYDANNEYPVSIATMKTAGQLPQEPLDPQTNTSYKYAYRGLTATPTAYHIGADMEQAVTATTLDTADADLVTSGVGTANTLTGWTTGFFGSSVTATDDPGTATCSAASGGTSFCYDVSNVSTP